jgi:hypothetical protein
MAEGPVTGIASMAKIYPNKNPELRRLALRAFECARNTIKEGAAGATVGTDPHFPVRQQGYVVNIRELLGQIVQRPIPDGFGLPDTQYPIDLSEPLTMITTDVTGAEIPLNEDLQLATIQWFTLAVQIASSDSAGWRGSANRHDTTRFTNQINVVEKLIAEIAGNSAPDFAATSDPGADRD